MVKVRNPVKLLRRLGIALIFVPELITTPIGVALVLAARYLTKRREVSLNKRIQEVVRYYLAHTRLFHDDAEGRSSALGLAKSYTRSEESLLSCLYAGSRGFEVSLAPSAWQNWQDMQDRTVHHTIDMQSLSWRYKAANSFKVESSPPATSHTVGKVIHHTINIEWLSQCYAGLHSTGAHSDWAGSSGAAKGVTHHSIDIRSLSQCYKACGVGQTKVKYHTINVPLLLQRYGPVVGSAKALSAVQSNIYLQRGI